VQKNINKSREFLEKELDSLRKVLEKQNIEISRCEEVERSLRESEEKYRFLVENSKDIIWKVDLQGRWTFISSNVEKVMGYEPEDIIGKMIWDFIAPDYFNMVKEKLEQRILGEEIHRTSWRSSTRTATTCRSKS
jgi:PAS domain-containing protein